MRAVDQKLKDVDDAETLKLFEELQAITGVNPSDYADFTVYHFLQQCLHPHGSGKPLKIERKRIEDADDHNSFVLRKKVGKVGNELHRIFRNLTPSIDHDAGTAVYMLLNRTMIIPKKKKKR